MLGIRHWGGSMSQFLFVVEVPKVQGISTEAHYAPEWNAFAKSASDTLKSIRGSQQLQLNAWLIPVEHSWPALESLAHKAKGLDLSCSILLIDDVKVLTPKP
jgi:hypothetical protein